MKRLVFLFFLVGFIHSVGYSQVKNVETDCSEYRDTVLDIHYYRRFYAPSTCYLDLVPMSQNNLVYRSFLFGNEGLFMVFTSYGPGPGSQDTGARVFYFFPRQRVPHAISGNMGLVVQTASLGIEFILDPSNSRVLALLGGEVSEDPKVHKGDNGGIEIKKHRGLMLDIGFALGHDPSSEPERKVYFEDSGGRRCTVGNKEIFSYSSSGDNSFIFSTDLELGKYLNKRCPQLKLDF